METTTDFYDMKTLPYLVIKENWVDVGYWTIFCVNGGYWGIILNECWLFWVGGVSESVWGIILRDWARVGKYLGWLGVSTLFDSAH